MGNNSHEEINASQLFDTCVHSFLDALHAPDIDGAEAEDFRAFSRGGYVFGHAFGLLDVAANDAGIGS